MRFKTKEIENQWHNPKLDIRVMNIAIWIDNYFQIHYGFDSILTSIWRDWGSGVHQDWRAIDIGSNNFTHTEARKIRDIVNAQFPRKGIYKTCVYHDVGYGWHFHIQVGWKKNIIDKPLLSQYVFFGLVIILTIKLLTKGLK